MHVQATGLSTYQQTWQLRRHGRAHQAVLLAEDLDMQFCTLITAAVHDRHRYAAVHAQNPLPALCCMSLPPWPIG